MESATQIIWLVGLMLRFHIHSMRYVFMWYANATYLKCACDAVLKIAIFSQYLIESPNISCKTCDILTNANMFLRKPQHSCDTNGILEICGKPILRHDRHNFIASRRIILFELNRVLVIDDTIESATQIVWLVGLKLRFYINSMRYVFMWYANATKKNGKAF